MKTPIAMRMRVRICSAEPRRGLTSTAWSRRATSDGIPEMSIAAMLAIALFAGGDLAGEEVARIGRLLGDLSERSVLVRRERRELEMIGIVRHQLLQPRGLRELAPFGTEQR